MPGLIFGLDQPPQAWLANVVKRVWTSIISFKAIFLGTLIAKTFRPLPALTTFVTYLPGNDRTFETGIVETMK
jgi:hypothetical protein